MNDSGDTLGEKRFADTSALKILRRGLVEIATITSASTEPAIRRTIAPLL
jgi:hypothetical protein